MPKFNVGDLVEHRASGEQGVVLERRVQKESVPERYDYLLSTGFRRGGYSSRSATEAIEGEKDLWVPESVLRRAYEPVKLDDNSPTTDRTIPAGYATAADARAAGVS